MSLLGAIGGVFVCARDCAKARKVDGVGNVFTVAKEIHPKGCARSSAAWLSVFAPNGHTCMRHCARKTAAAVWGLYGPPALPVP